MNPVFCYLANIIDYFRVIMLLAAFALYQNPRVFVVLYATSAILDLFDGMAARAFNQTSRLGASLDMITDRVSTTGLMFILSNLYPQYQVLFILSVTLDIYSHWTQVYSTYASGSQSHKASAGSQSIILRFYYSKKALFIFCFSAEAFIIAVYWIHFEPWLMDIPAFFAFVYAVGAIFLAKQFIHIVQLWAAMNKVADLDILEKKLKEDEEKAKAKAN